MECVSSSPPKGSSTRNSESNDTSCMKIGSLGATLFFNKIIILINKKKLNRQKQRGGPYLNFL